jgi:hypothetical protein
VPLHDVRSLPATSPQRTPIRTTRHTRISCVRDRARHCMRCTRRHPARKNIPVYSHSPDEIEVFPQALCHPAPSHFHSAHAVSLCGAVVQHHLSLSLHPSGHGHRSSVFHIPGGHCRLEPVGGGCGRIIPGSEAPGNASRLGKRSQSTRLTGAVLRPPLPKVRVLW